MSSNVILRKSLPNNNHSLIDYNDNNNNISCKSQQQSSVVTCSTKSKVSPTRRLKNLLKPLLGRVFKTARAKQLKRNSYVAASPLAERDNDYEWLSNDMENRANEHLEQQLIAEMETCADDAAIVIYDEVGCERLQTVDKEQIYVPVHFARTNAGTFFWTSLQRQSIEPYNIEWNFMDRWAQA